MTEVAALAEKGALHLEGLIHADLYQWEEATEQFFARAKPGVRIADSAPLASCIHGLLDTTEWTQTAGKGWKCVRAIAFNKSTKSNWALGWHQDRTIAVQEQHDVDGYTVWSQKDGLLHVEPPFSLLERMITLRLHLDDVPLDNAPLLIAEGSHRLGRIREKEIERSVNEVETTTCTAKSGDGWLYATPILHASSRSASSCERRVLHLDFSCDPLPPPLKWAGIELSL